VITDTTAYLGIGGNQEQTLFCIKKLKAILSKTFPNYLHFSSIYSSPPFCNVGTGRYYNMCVRINVGDMTPENLLAIVLNWEKELGRIRGGIKWESRVIDIDILLFGEIVISKDNLKIPHYDLQNRDFFLLPLSEISPDILIPPLNSTIRNALKNIPENLLTYPEKCE